MVIANFISSWLENIVVLFILISITELVMPKGNMKKYVDLIIGILIIFTIITPFAKLVNKDFNLDQAVFNFSKQDDSSNGGDERLYLEQEKQVEKLYKEKIKNQIKELIEEESPYIVIDMSVEILDSEERYGEIESVQLSIGENVKDAESKKIEINKVEPIQITGESKDMNDDNEEKYKELKELIWKNYAIEKDKINIKNYDKGNGE